MKFPLLGFMTRSLTLRVAALFVLAISLTLTATAQKSSPIILGNDSASLEQCRNGASGSPELCTGNKWTTGNTGASNSHWEERQFVAYRMLFGNISPGTNTVVIGYDRIHSGKHAIDYLGSYNATEPSPGNNPCSGVTGCTGWTISTVGVPMETTLPATVPQIAGVFTMWGGTFVGAPTYVPCGVGDESLVRCVRIQFSPQSGIENPVMAWGGHIAWRGEWGAGQSAGGISGSPYHMRLEELNGSGGNQDRSLSAQGVFGPGSMRVVKQVQTNPAGTSSTVQFFFNADTEFGTSNFFLVDDDAGPGIDSKLSAPINTFNGTANVVTVSENTAAFPVNQNWSFNGWGNRSPLPVTSTCSEDKSTVGTIYTPGSASVTVVVDPEETVVCIFNNSQLGPSAAQVSISGRTTNSFGAGIGGTRVTIMDTSNGATWSAITNPFGYYTIEGLDVGSFYIMTVGHKRYTFADDTRSFTLSDELVGMDFVANP